MTSGNYVRKFSEASHAVFEGHLDDPSFRSIAVQEIKSHDGASVTLEQSGALKIQTDVSGREIVRVSYVCPLFGRQHTIGHPFKDKDCAAVTAPPTAHCPTDH